MSSALAVYHGGFGRAALYRLDRGLATHAHREGHLTFHVDGPPARLTVAGTPVPLDGTSACAVNPWQAHSYDPVEQRRETLVLLLYIKPSWFLEAGRCAQGALRFGRNRIEVSAPVGRLVQVVASLLLEDDESPLFDGYLYELARECFEQSRQGSPAAAMPPEPWCRTRDYRVRNSIDLMGRRIRRELVLDDIARDVGLSRPHFFKLFKQHVGLTPNIYLNTLRMETAIERLTGSEDAVTAIGLDLGFASQTSFTRFFTANVGIPPTDYRRAAHVG